MLMNNPAAVSHPVCFASRRRGIFVACLFWLGMLGATAAVEPNAARVISVGVLDENYPFSFSEHGDAPRGYAVDLLAAIEHTMGLQLRRTVGKTAEINAAFTEGRLDLLQSFAQSAARESQADFSVPYLTMSGSIFVRAGLENIHSLADLRGRKVLVHAGSLGEQVLRAAGLSNSIVIVASVDEAFRQLESGQGDATLAGRLTGLMAIYRHKLQKVRAVAEPVPDFTIRYCFAVREGDRELLAKVNEGLAIIERTGVAERIRQKWFGPVEPVHYSALQITLAVTVGLAVALVVTVWGFFRQRVLRQRIVQQADQLRRSEELYRGVFDHSLYGLILVSEQEGALLLERMNAAALRLLGGESPQVERLDLRTAFPADRPLWDHLRRHMADANAPTEFEHARPGLPGATWVRGSVARVGAQWQIVLGDLSAAKQAEEKLKVREQQLIQSQKLEAIGTLSSGIAHDFNNILTSIICHAELLRQDLPANPSLVTSNEEISKAAERARQLVRQILSFCRQTDTRREVIEVTPVVNEALRFLRATTPSTVEIRHQPVNPPACIKADVTQVHQVLMNLVTNAVQSLGGQPGLIEVTEERVRVGSEVIAQHPQLHEGEYLRVAVRDDGCGMDAEVVRRIFEPFFTTKGPGGGTGLGLAVVHGILQAHGGAVTVYSRPGRGSVFQLYFPVVKYEAAPTMDPKEQAPPRGRGELVLFIDDEEPIVRITGRLLQRLGYTASLHTDAVAALADFEARRHEFAVVFTDLNMPRLGGLELVARVRQIRPEIPTIVASGFLAEGDVAWARELQVTQLLDKPLTLEAVARALAAALDKNSGHR
jgi:signal transduction histidine kinase/ABC-type amino acid transport substrate-binding protein/ActR/RegA family two-component response regulator